MSQLAVIPPQTAGLLDSSWWHQSIAKSFKKGQHRLGGSGMPLWWTSQCTHWSPSLPWLTQMFRTVIRAYTQTQQCYSRQPECRLVGCPPPKKAVRLKFRTFCQRLQLGWCVNPNGRGFSLWTSQHELSPLTLPISTLLEYLLVLKQYRLSISC